MLWILAQAVGWIAGLALAIPHARQVRRANRLARLKLDERMGLPPAE